MCRVNIQVYMLQIVISTCKLSVFVQLKSLFAVPVMSQARHFIAILLFYKYYQKRCCHGSMLP